MLGELRRHVKDMKDMEDLYKSSMEDLFRG
jgi:hypothetical protein